MRVMILADNRKGAESEKDVFPGSRHVLTLLRSSLAVAVPLEVERWAGRPFAERQAAASRAAQEIAEHGDNLMFRSRPGESARVFSALTTAVAIGALQPGGIRSFGLHFEAIGDVVSPVTGGVL